MNVIFEDAFERIGGIATSDLTLEYSWLAICSLLFQKHIPSPAGGIPMLCARELKKEGGRSSKQESKERQRLEDKCRKY